MSTTEITLSELDESSAAYSRHEPDDQGGYLAAEFKKFHEEMVKAVELKGSDYRYEWFSLNGEAGSCDYLEYHDRLTGDRVPRHHVSLADLSWMTDTTPSCIVGHVMAGLGVSHEELAASEGVSAYTCASPANVPPQVRKALLIAQRIQDSGDTWGKALSAFVTEMNSALLSAAC